MNQISWQKSNDLVYRAYGLYEPVAVAKETKRLLEKIDLLLLAEPEALGKLPQEARQLLKKYQALAFKEPVQGFFKPPCTVTLYEQAILAAAAKLALEPAVVKDGVICHEAFHYKHYQALAGFQQEPLSYWYGGKLFSKEATVVKESLAEFCRYRWAVEQGHVSLAEAMVRRLKSIYGAWPSWPYGGAKGLIDLYAKDPEGAISKAEEIFRLSLISWPKAYAALGQVLLF